MDSAKTVFRGHDDDHRPKHDPAQHNILSTPI
jgi:hypothetical protein